VRTTWFFLAEALGLTLLLRALMGPLWGRAGSELPAVLGVWLLYAAGAVVVAGGLATLLPGVVYGLLYNATGSLTVVITAHTLSNWVGFHPALLAAATKTSVAGIAAAGALAFLFLLLIVFRGNREMRLLAEATAKMFRDRPGMGLVSGVVIGLVLLATWPLRWPPVYTGLAGVLLVGVSLLGKRRAG
jgi:hypothetical protein